MKRTFFYVWLGILFLIFTAFSVHKFYMAIYQINYAPEKKMLQITSRIFVDDLNKALEKKHNKKLYLGTQKETAEEISLLKKYMEDNFVIKVNGKVQTMHFLSKELDGDVLVCYSSIKEISKINSLEVSNKILTDWVSEQQNIIHVTVLGVKKSLLFTETLNKQLLKY